MTDEEIRIEASKARAEEEERKRRDKALLRFKFPEAARQQVKDAYMKVVDQQLDAVEESYPSIFAAFSVDELEGMSEADASGFVRMVVDSIAGALSGSEQKLKTELCRVTSDRSAIESLSKAFRESCGAQPQEKKD